LQAFRLASHCPAQMTLEAHQIPDQPPAGAIIARAAATLISAGTEVANYLGQTSQRTLSSTEPYYPGYSFAGVVEAVGEGVDRFRPGDRICGPLPHASHAIEGRQERLARLTRIPDSVTFRQAATTQLGCIALNGVRAAKIQLGRSVAVVGAGLVGLLAGRLASLDGGFPWVALDLMPQRRDAAVAYGAQQALNPRDTATAAALHTLAPAGFDVVIEATGSPRAFAPALALAARGGTVVLLGSTRGLVEAFDPYTDVHKKGITIVGSHVSTTPTAGTPLDPWTEPANREVLLALMQDGRLEVDSLITDIVTPEMAADAFKALAADPAGQLGVAIDWEGLRRPVAVEGPATDPQEVHGDSSASRR
jgi:threonine dehydrogenase-like Zn-dependent dehydrogenase